MTSMPPNLGAAVGGASVHKPFSWLPDGDQSNRPAKINADAMDAFRGIATCLQLIEMSNLDRELDDPSDPERVVPILNMQDTGRLMRLAILVATEWGDKADVAMLNINDNDTERSVK
jgi:hypothetical protein